MPNLPWVSYRNEDTELGTYPVSVKKKVKWRWNWTQNTKITVPNCVGAWMGDGPRSAGLWSSPLTFKPAPSWTKPSDSMILYAGQTGRKSFGGSGTETLAKKWLNSQWQVFAKESSFGLPVRCQSTARRKTRNLNRGHVTKRQFSATVSLMKWHNSVPFCSILISAC